MTNNTQRAYQWMIAVAMVAISTTALAGKDTNASSEHNARQLQTKKSEQAPVVEGADLIEVQDENRACRKLPASLRQMFYSHFNYLIEGKSPRQKNALAERFARTLALAAKESNGNAADTSDMNGRGSDYSVKKFFREENKGKSESAFLRISLGARNDMLNNDNVRITHQTNYGLLQMSADRLSLSKSSRERYAYYKEVVLSDVRKGYEICRTQFMYKDDTAKLLSALKEAASCTEGAKSEKGIKCFGRFTTICPALNADLGVMAPEAYFQTRGAAPRCQDVFEALAKKSSSSVAQR